MTTASGLAFGLAGAAALSRTLESLLFEVSPLDPSAFLFAAVAMGGVAGVAAFIPAWRAARVNPVQVLQAEG